MTRHVLCRTLSTAALLGSLLAPSAAAADDVVPVDPDAVAWATSPRAAGAAMELVVRWEAGVTEDQRRSTLAAAGVSFEEVMATVADVQRVRLWRAKASPVHDAHKVEEKRDDLRVRLFERAGAAGRLAGTSPGDTKAHDDALDDLADADDDVRKAVDALQEEWTKHRQRTADHLEHEATVRWADTTEGLDLGDDRFHAWPKGGHVEVSWRERQREDLASAHAVATGRGVTVAVIDTGGFLDAPGVVGGWDFVGDDGWPVDKRNEIDDDGDGEVDEAFGHGTHVLSLVHAVAPDADLLVYRALDADGVGDPIAIGLAIEAAVLAGADVINLSAGSEYELEAPALLEALDLAKERDVVVVAAAGNRGTTYKSYPAAHDAVESVGATDGKAKIAPFSNRGKWTRLAAPGVDVAGLLPNGRTAAWSGTSFATPLVAGQFALLREAFPGDDGNDLRKRARDTAQPIEGLELREVDIIASLQG